VELGERIVPVFLDLLREQHGSIRGYLTDAGVEPDVFDAQRERLPA
jgi:hypothetical protein